MASSNGLLSIGRRMRFDPKTGPAATANNGSALVPGYHRRPRTTGHHFVRAIEFVHALFVLRLCRYLHFGGVDICPFVQIKWSCQQISVSHTGPQSGPKSTTLKGLKSNLKSMPILIRHIAT